MKSSNCSLSFDKRLLSIHIVVLLFIFGFQYLPPIGHVTPFGMSLLGIFIGCIIGWCTIGFELPCIAALISLGLGPAYNSFNEMLGATFGFNIAVMMMMCLFICAFVEITGLPNVIIGYMLNLKIVRKNNKIFMFIFFLTCYFVSSLSNSSVSAYLFVDLYRTLANELKIPEKSKLNNYTFVGITFSSILGEIAFPFKPVSVVIIGLCQSSSGVMLSFFDYIIFLTSFQIVMLIIFVLLGPLVFRVDFSQISKINIPKITPNMRQSLCLISIGILFFAFVLSSMSLPFFSYIGLGGVSIVVVLMMLFIQVDKKPLLNLSEIASRFGWGMYLLTVMFIPFSALFGSQDAGITITIKDYFGDFLTSLPPLTFIIIVLSLTVLFTSFLVNMPVAVIFISLMNAMQSSLTGINFSAACLAIATCAFISMATPAANSAAVYVYSFTNFIDLPKIMFIGSIVSIILCIVSIFAYYPFLAMFI